MPHHAEQRILPYPPHQLFELVADVDRYPEFLPWVVAARVLDRSDDQLRAELAVGFKGIRERFVSRVALDRANLRIDVAYEDGPFNYLENHWVFHPHGKSGCRIDFEVDFEFKSRILKALMGRLFQEAVMRMVRAFESRAAALYGPGAGLVPGEA